MSGLTHRKIELFDSAIRRQVQLRVKLVRFVGRDRTFIIRRSGNATKGKCFPHPLGSFDNYRRSQPFSLANQRQSKSFSLRRVNDFEIAFCQGASEFKWFWCVMMPG